jgi:cytochrome c-type biogenesis protein CcmH/NrfG
VCAAELWKETSRIPWEAFLKHDVTGAIEDFEKAVSKDPKFALGWAGLSGAVLTQKAFDAAATAAVTAIELDANQTPAAKAVAEGLGKMGQGEAALRVLKALEKAQSRDPNGHAEH